MRCDPLTKLFGRDIAGMIYLMVWNDLIRAVNEQYQSLLVSDSKTGGIEFIDTYEVTGRPTFVFNARQNNVYRGLGIYRWNAPYDLWAPAKLPEHYWEIPELY